MFIPLTNLAPTLAELRAPEHPEHKYLTISISKDNIKEKE